MITTTVEAGDTAKLFDVHYRIRLGARRWWPDEDLTEHDSGNV